MQNHDQTQILHNQLTKPKTLNQNNNNNNNNTNKTQNTVRSKTKYQKYQNSKPILINKIHQNTIMS